jgi:RNA polymerase sigma factor (sigma-70 family)
MYRVPGWVIGRWHDQRERTAPDMSDPSTLADDELLARCRDGQQAAWSTLVRRYQRLVYTVPRRMGLPDEACADVFQAAFARLVEHLDRIDDPARVRAWLVTTARRESLRLLEARSRVVELAASSGDDPDADPWERIADDSPRAEEQLEELQQLDRLRQAVDRLDPRTRRFVEVVFLRDPAPAYAEIAHELGIAEGSIGPTRARCLAKLRAALEALA